MWFVYDITAIGRATSDYDSHAICYTYSCLGYCRIRILGLEVSKLVNKQTYGWSFTESPGFRPRLQPPSLSRVMPFQATKCIFRPQKWMFCATSKRHLTIISIGDFHILISVWRIRKSHKTLGTTESVAIAVYNKPEKTKTHNKAVAQSTNRNKMGGVNTMKR